MTYAEIKAYMVLSVEYNGISAAKLLINLIKKKVQRLSHCESRVKPKCEIPKP